MNAIVPLKKKLTFFHVIEYLLNLQKFVKCTVIFSIYHPVSDSVYVGSLYIFAVMRRMLRKLNEQLSTES